MEARDLQTGRTRELFRITSAGMWTAGASVSPDAREVAFIARDGPATTIMIAPTAGGPPREIGRVTHDLVGQTTWTPDGGRVLTFRALVSGGELWSFPTKGGSPEKSSLRVRPSAGETTAVSPDGTQIAFVGGSFKAEVWVMTGLFQNTKAAPAR
jgi:Tol biopolymer transport system component